MQLFRTLAACSLVVSALAQQSLVQLIQGNPNLTEFESLLKAFPNLYSNLSSASDITVFAPSNAAFAKLNYTVLAPAFDSYNIDFQRELIRYHVAVGVHPSGSFSNGSFSFLHTLLTNQSTTNVTGGQVISVVEQAGNNFVAVSGLGVRAAITDLDVTFNNGVLHIIDTFLIPPPDLTTSSPSFNLTSAPAAFIAAPSILNDYVNVAEDLTIFAPNNAALQSIASSFSSMTVQDFTALVEYHIVPSNTTVYYSANLPNGAVSQNGSIYNTTTLTTLQGGNLTITFIANSLFVNQARIIQEDLLLSNGVLHIIDSVLDPNVTGVAANPENPAPVQVVPGSSLPGNMLPFTTDLPTSTSILFSLVTPTPTMTANGSEATGGGSAATSTGSGPLSTSKGWGERVEVGTGGTGIVLGALIWVLGFI
ncbi:hypothetical protein MMC11_001496 [Xylographa trunciseda]|nr:hypothetical protein [Xylographa trunciseda]